MKKQKTKKYFFRKKFFAALLCVSLLFSFCPTDKVYAWDAVIGATFGTFMTQLLDFIKAALLGALKQAAIKTSDRMIDKLVGGGSGSGPMFITDWQDYIVNQPERNTQLRMNNILTQLTQNKGSISGYTPNRAFEGTGPGSFNTGMSQYGNYFSRLVADTQSSLGRGIAPPTYQGNPAQMFAKGNTKDLSTYVFGNNSPWAFQWNAKAKEMQSLEDERDRYMSQSISGGGFPGKEVGGQVVTPGVTIKDILSNTKNTGNQAIASANSIPEVAVAAVIKVITGTIEGGIGNVQARVQKEITDVQTRNSTQMQNAVRTGGPGALYKR